MRSVNHLAVLPWPGWAIAGVLLLALASVLSLVLVPRWLPLGDGQAIADPEFATLASTSSAAPWQRLGNGRIEPVPNGVRLVNSDPESGVGIDQVISRPPAADALRVTATVTLEDVVAGPERWQQPRILVQSLSPAYRPYLHGPHQLIAAEGDFGPRRLTAVFPVSRDHDTARLMIRLPRATGAMTVTDLEVEAMHKPAVRVWLRHILISLWLAVGTAMAAVLWWQSHNRVAAAFLLAALAAMGLVVAFPDTLREPLHQLVNTVAGDQRVMLLKPVAHLLGFGILAMVSRLALSTWPLTLLVPGWLAAACLLELAEYRYGHFDAGDVVDMGFNASGALLGLALAGLIRRARQGDGAATAHAGRSDSPRRRP